MKNLSFIRTFLALAAGALMLAACGGTGGGDDGPSDPLVSGNQVPTSATTSCAGAFAFVSSVAASPDNTGEPLVVNDATLATCETDEPSPSV